MPIGQTVSEIWPFLFLKMAAVWAKFHVDRQTVVEIWPFFVSQLGFLKFRNFLTTGTVRIGPMCVTLPNIVPVSQTVAEIWSFFVYFQNGGRLPYWICVMRIWTTREHPLVGIGALLSIICKF